MWTDDPLFQPQPQGELMTRPYPDTILSNELTAKEIARVLAALAFHQGQDRKRMVHLSRLARNKIVTALLAQPLNLDDSGVSLSQTIVKRSEIS
jgi:hypothetical protein